MKKSLIFITLLLSARILHADPIQDIENAIKEGNITKVQELVNNLPGHQKLKALTEQIYNIAFEENTTNYSPSILQRIWRYTKAGAGMTVGVVTVGLGSCLTIIIPYATYKTAKTEGEYLFTSFAGGGLELVALATTAGGYLLCKYSAALLSTDNKKNEDMPCSAERVAKIKALAIKYDQDNTNLPR